MKTYFGLIYWSIMTAAVSLMLWSATGSPGTAFLLSVMLLPGVLFFKYFVGDLSYRDRRRGIVNTVYFALDVMLIEYLGIIFVYWIVNDYTHHTFRMPGIVTNPVFMWLLLGGLLSIEHLLADKLGGASAAQPRYATFTSNRRRVSLELDTIVCIESCDYEVVVHTADGTQYPTRMKISQWEAVLDARFVRIHRSFIVNRRHVTRVDARTVWVGERALEVSRKYHEHAMDKLR